MTTPTSLFERKRFWKLYGNVLWQRKGYWGLTSAIIFLFYPVQYLLQLVRRTNLAPEVAEAFLFTGPANNFVIISAMVLVAALLLGSLTLGLMLNSYMFSKKAVDVYHGLPVSRTTMVLANTAAAMTILWSPLIVSNLIIGISGALHPYAVMSVGALGAETLFFMLITLCIYVITTLVCTQVGTLFNAFLHTGILLCAPPLVTLIFDFTCEMFLRGFVFSEELARTILFLSPVTLVINYFVSGTTSNPEYADWMLRHWIVTGVYVLLTLGLLILTVILYARRKSEQAETLDSDSAIPFFGQTAGTYLGGFAIGMMFYLIGGRASIVGSIFGVGTGNADSDEEMNFFLWTLVGAILAFLILEVILNRGFKRLKRHLPMGAGMVAVTMASLAVVMTGAFGYETRLPNAEDVASVEILNADRILQTDGLIMRILSRPIEGVATVENVGTMPWGDEVTLTSPTAIDTVLRFHRGVVNSPEREKNSSATETASRELAQTMDMAVRSQKIVRNMNLTLRYHLKNGQIIQRRYDRFPAIVGMELLPMITDEEYLRQTQSVFHAQAEQVQGWWIEDGLHGAHQEKVLSREQNQQLLGAMKADRLAMTEQQLIAPEKAPLAFLEADMYSSHRAEPQGAPALPADAITFAERVSFTVSEDTPQTLALMKTFGILPPTPDGAKFVAAAAIGDELAQPMPSGVLDINRNGYSFASFQEYQGYLENEYEKFNFLFGTEDKAFIEKLLKSVRATWRGDEPVLQVQFFTSTEANETDEFQTYSGMVPLSLLTPEELALLSANTSNVS